MITRNKLDNVIPKIIDDLIDTDKSIKSALLKTKVLARQMKVDELSLWVGNELNGYSDANDLPTYREVNSQVRGHIINGMTERKNMLIDSKTLKKEGSMHSMRIMNGISSIEDMYANRGTEPYVKNNLPSEALDIINYDYRKMGNEFFECYSASRCAPVSVLDDIASSVRSNLIDFLMDLNDKFGSLTFDEIIVRKSEIKNVMNKYEITGHGNTINSGDNVEINTNVSVTEGSKDELAKVLRQSEVGEKEIAELVELVDRVDKKQISPGHYGDEVNGWISRMLEKSLQGSWGVSVAAAGGVLSTILNKFFGLS